MAFNSIPSWNSELKEVMKVFRESAVQNIFIPFSQWKKKTTYKTGEGKNKEQSKKEITGRYL